MVKVKVKFTLEQATKAQRVVEVKIYLSLKHCGRVTQICVFNTVKLGTSASSP